MTKLLPEEFPKSKYPKGANHAMFCEYSCGNNVVQIRNSWGTSHQAIKIDLNKHKDVRVYYIWVTDFIWKAQSTGKEDVLIIKNKLKLNPSKWPNYGFKTLM